MGGVLYSASRRPDPGGVLRVLELAACELRLALLQVGRGLGLRGRGALHFGGPRIQVWNAPLAFLELGRACGELRFAALEIGRQLFVSCGRGVDLGSSPFQVRECALPLGELVGVELELPCARIGLAARCGQRLVGRQ